MRRSQFCRTPWRGLLFVLVGGFAIGCGRTPPQPAAQSSREKNSGFESTANDSAVARDAVTLDGRDLEQQTPQHPIDQLPEGKLFRLALHALDNGDRATAERLRERLANDSQYGVLADAIRANMLAHQEAYDQALQAAEDISRVPVMRAEAYMIAGEVFRRQQRWSQAIGAYQSAVQSHPHNVRAHRWLGVVYHDTGAMRLATKHLRKVAELDEDDFRALRLSGLIHYEYQNFEQAIADYRRALQRNPPELLETEMRVELADSLRELRQVDEAVETLRSCKDGVEVVIARAKCWETQGKLEKAEELARRAVETEAANAEANFVLGRILLAQRSIDDALPFLQTAVELEPTNHEPRFLLGRALLQAGRDDEGRAQLEESERLKLIFLEMAELHLDAIDRPSDAELRVRLGQLAEKLGRPKLARYWYTAALGLEPDSADAATALAQLQDEPSQTQSP